MHSILSQLVIVVPSMSTLLRGNFAATFLVMFRLICSFAMAQNDSDPVIIREKRGEKYVYGLMDQSGRILKEPSFDELYPFNEGRAEFAKDGKWGHLDTSANIIGSDQWDEAWAFKDGLAQVKKDNRFGFVDREGKVAIPVQIENYSKYGFIGGVSVARKEGRAGLIDKKGEWVLAPTFSGLGRDPECLDVLMARREKDSQSEIIDLHGRTLVSDITQLEELDPKAEVYIFGRGKEKEKRFGIFNKAGKIVTDPIWEKYRWIASDEKVPGGIYALHSPDLAEIKKRAAEAGAPWITYPDRTFSDDMGTLWIDKTGKAIAGFSSWTPRVEISPHSSFRNRDEDCLVVKVGNDIPSRYGVLTFGGKVVVPFDYSSIIDTHGGFLVSSTTKNGSGDNETRGGLIDRTGKWLITMRQDMGYNLRSNRVAFRAENGKYGFVDGWGHIVIQPTFSWVSEFGDAEKGEAVVCMDDDLTKAAWGSINEDGEFIIKPAHRVIPFVSELWTEKHLYNRTMPDLHWFAKAHRGLMTACQPNKTEEGYTMGVVDGTGQWIVPPNYHSIRFEQDLIFAEVRQFPNKRFPNEIVPPLGRTSTSVYDLAGRLLFTKPGEVSLIESSSLRGDGPVFQHEVGKKKGALDGAGNNLIPVNFGWIEPIKTSSSSVAPGNSLFLVQDEYQGKKWALFNSKGKACTSMSLDYEGVKAGSEQGKPYAMKGRLLFTIAQEKWLYFDRAGTLLWEEK